MDVKSLIENPMVKSLLLGKLKKAWKENKLSMITITEKNGELEFEIYTEQMKVLTQKDFVNIITNP
jgi:hypothetical protein